MEQENDRVLAQLQEQTQWLRFLALKELRPVLEEALQEDSHRRIYDLSDGRRTAREIAQAAGVTHPTVLRLWSKWMALGIASEGDRPGRCRRLVGLDDLGIAHSPREAPRKRAEGKKDE